MFSYDRKEHIDYLKNLTKEGTYQDYQNEIYHMVELGIKINNEGAVEIACNKLIDQADGVCYGDLFFPMERKKTDIHTAHATAEKIVETLCRYGIDVDESCLYYNTTLHGFMYTAVAIKADDAPDLYAGQARTFLIR